MDDKCAFAEWVLSTLVFCTSTLPCLCFPLHKHQSDNVLQRGDKKKPYMIPGEVEKLIFPLKDETPPQCVLCTRSLYSVSEYFTSGSDR